MFNEAAPRADDVWLNFVAVDSGFKTAQVGTQPRHWAFVPGSQAIALNSSNVWGDANDSQLRYAHTDATRERIWSDARDTPEGRSGTNLRPGS